MPSLRLLLLTGAILLPAVAAAETCPEAVDRFAQAHGLTVALPQRPAEQTAGPPVAPATKETRGLIGMSRLADSGGVLPPPRTGDPAVVAPPKTADPMPTAPRIEPAPPQAATEPPSTVRQTPPTELSAAERAQAEALLYAAKAAAEEGKSEQCFERLQQAQRLLPSG